MNAIATKLSLDLPVEPDGPARLRSSIRRLGMFLRTMDFACRRFNARYDLDLAISRRDLTRAFFEWVREFSRQRDLADRDRRDFSHFAAGLLLRSLIRHRPVTNARSGRRADAPATGAERDIVDFWPEGVFYFEFCITVLDKVLAEQALDGIDVAPDALELRTWQSFRENVAADPNVAIPFLDLLLGNAPEWDLPAAARFRAALRDRLLDSAPQDRLRL